MFQVGLINDPFADPGVYLELRYRPEALLFDLGDIHDLAPRKLHKIGHVFVSHTHMDHFIGFDQLLRVCLGRNRRIRLFGPPGIIASVEHRLGAYTWNLVRNYSNDFALSVTELAEGGHWRMRDYRCRTAFAPEAGGEGRRRGGRILEERLFTVDAAFLDHQIPSLAFRWAERQRIAVKKNALDEMGLAPGPWLMTLKERLIEGASDAGTILARWRDEKGRLREREATLGELRERAVRIDPGRSVVYVTDAQCSKANAERIVALAAGAELLFIEAAFLDADRRQAQLKHHLTARQAGWLARRAGVKRLQLFHFSPKYTGAGDRLTAEALAAFRGKGEV